MNRGQSFIPFFAVFFLTCGSRIEQKPSLSVEGFWNMRSFQTRDSRDVQFTTLIFSFASDSSCQVPTRVGQPFSITDGSWWFDSNSQQLMLDVVDTLFTGPWTLDNVRYSTTKGFERVILEMDICNQHACAHIARF